MHHTAQKSVADQQWQETNHGAHVYLLSVVVIFRTKTTRTVLKLPIYGLLIFLPPFSYSGDYIDPRHNILLEKLWS